MEEDDRTLFIGNIDKNVTEEILYELFLQAGPIESVRIISNRNESSRYGFVTYKHESSINYALDIFKGTFLFKKELSIKKRCPKNKASNPDKQDPAQGRPSDFQDQLQYLEVLGQNVCYGSQALISFTSSALRGHLRTRNKFYDAGMKNHFSKPRDVRDRRKARDYRSKMYYGRKTRGRRD